MVERQWQMGQSDSKKRMTNLRNSQEKGTDAVCAYKELFYILEMRWCKVPTVEIFKHLMVCTLHDMSNGIVNWTI